MKICVEELATVKNKKYADLSWSPNGSGNVDVYRNEALRTTTANDGSYRDSLPKGTGTVTYKVCLAGSTACSNEAPLSY